MLTMSNANCDITFFLSQEITIGEGWHIQTPFCVWFNWYCACRCCNSLFQEIHMNYIAFCLRRWA